MTDLRSRLVDLFTTEFVVSRAGFEDPNEAAAGRAVEVVAEWLRAEADRFRADRLTDRQRADGGDRDYSRTLTDMIYVLASLADSIGPQGEPRNGS